MRQATTREVAVAAARDEPGTARRSLPGGDGTLAGFGKVVDDTLISGGVMEA